LLALIKALRFKVLTLFLWALLCMHSKELEGWRAVRVWQSNSWSCHADGEDSNDADIAADDTIDVLSDDLRLLRFFNNMLIVILVMVLCGCGLWCRRFEV